MTHYERKKNKHSFGSGNNAAEKHGISRAVKALQHGDEFTGPAREAELAIREEHEAVGMEPIRQRNRFRLQAVSDLLWLEIVKHAQAGNDEKRDGYIKQFIYATNSANKEWDSAKDTEEDSTINAIEAARDSNVDTNTH